MKNLQKLLIIIILSLGFYSCGDHRLSLTLADIESYIDSRPDSALAAIRQIDTTELRGRAAKAKYALLHAIALDKNYIDNADTRVVQPAVDYYDRHGSPEQRLKAYMYLGTEQYNAGRYNQAIVSFSHAAEFAEKVDDQNLLGILYSRMADTFTATKEYTPAASYIGKSLACFRKSGRKDQERLVQVNEAVNLAQRKEWRRADSCFMSLSSDSTLAINLKSLVLRNYALEILYNQSRNDLDALEIFESAMKYGGDLTDLEQLCGYAYVLGVSGQTERSDSLFNVIESHGDAAKYNLLYWRHRTKLKKNDYKLAYDYLLAAENLADSIKSHDTTLSAEKSHKEYLEKDISSKETSISRQRHLFCLYLLLSILIIILIIVLQANRRRLNIEKQGRMEIVIDSLNEQIRDMRSEMENLTRTHTKARFSYTAKLYELVYHLGREGISKERLYQIVNKEVKTLKNDAEAQANFERLLNQEGSDIMGRFRESFNNLSEDEYRLASLIFAGYDNTTILLIMGISTLEYVRVKKSRLKQKIEDSRTADREVFLKYFTKKGGNR